jgi:hypothetical protein
MNLAPRREPCSVEPSMSHTLDSPGVMLWWRILGTVSVANILVWLLLTRHEVADEHGPRRRERLLQVALSGAFVLGCAFRSFLPRAEGQRIVLLDSAWSSLFLSRAVATVAELSLVAQWSLALGRWTRDVRSRLGYAMSRALLPLIAVAECFSWYTTLTTDFRGSVIEESTWAFTSTLMTLTLVLLWWQRREFRRPFLGAAIVLNAAYIMFMTNVDVPMYRARVRADAASGRTFVSLADGARDALTRRVLTRRWDDWKDEIPWMTLYFTAGVWISLALVRAPRLAPQEE